MATSTPLSGWYPRPAITYRGMRRNIQAGRKSVGNTNPQDRAEIFATKAPLLAKARRAR